jgi:hypothetical protein
LPRFQQRIEFFLFLFARFVGAGIGEHVGGAALAPRGIRVLLQGNFAFFR